MVSRKTFPFLLLSTILWTFSAGSGAQNTNVGDVQDSLQEARKVCSSLTAENKQLAKVAGYDLDKLCSGLHSLKLTDETDDEQPVVLPRGQKSSELDDSQMSEEPHKPQQSDETKIVPGELTPFGYDLFAGEPTSFQPAASAPVSPSYLLGPGDTIQLRFYGKLNESYDLEINRAGSIDFPQLGPITLAGMPFSDAQKLLQKRISKEMIGVEASISLGQLRSIQVFMLGEAYKTGTYTISALSTITNALFLSGGVSDIASLRSIQLKRAGSVVATLDLYDLLLRGDTSKDAQLQSGDAIYIPTVKTTAAVDGEVRRPAIYELKGHVTAEQLAELAGGLLPTAFHKRARIHRVGTSGFMTVLDIDLSTEKGRKTQIKSGDRLMVDAAVEQQESIVRVSGHVHHPGEFLWRDGLRISDVLTSVNRLKKEADLDFALIHREMPPVGKIEPIFVDLRALLADPKSSANIPFFPRDELIVFSNQPNRAETLEQLVEALKQQSRSGEMARVASIAGTVRSPGEYPLTQGMTLTQLIAAAGGLKEEAYTQVVELSRQDFSDVEGAVSDHRRIALADAINDPKLDPMLQPYDVVAVRTIPEFRESLSVKLQGEVRFPGTYAFKRGETLTQVLERAGGLTAMAHASAAVFTREDLREQEAKQLEDLRKRLRADLATAGLEQANEGESVDIDDGKKLLSELESSQALGRLVLDLPSILDGSLEDVTLKNGDLLVIPEYHQEIAVIGEIQHPSSHLFNRKYTLQDYIDLSGGTNNRADKKRIYVVKADGSVALPGRSGWFKRRYVSIDPGDTIIVPLDIDRRRALTVWSEASTIIYQLALGAAAINSF